MKTKTKSNDERCWSGSRRNILMPRNIFCRIWVNISKYIGVACRIRNDYLYEFKMTPISCFKIISCVFKIVLIEIVCLG